MINPKTCPVCERMVRKIEKWRHIYICVPCLDKFEKIEEILKSGQFLDEAHLREIVNQFGKTELDKIKNSESVHIRKKRGRRRRVEKNNEANIKGATKRKKRV